METKKEIHLSKAGTLKQFITDQEKDDVTHLKISGYINSKDFDVLDYMCTSWGINDDDDNYIMYEDEPPFLKVLDLGNCIIKGRPVLGEFAYHSKLEEIILPKNLISTGDCEVFCDSVFLEKVIFPDTLKEIGYGTFTSCEKLQNVELPKNLERIGSIAFSGCENLKSIKIPENVTQIEDSAFAYCYNIEKFELDEQNSHFSIIDGVLFNRDKTKLVSFPCGSKNKNYIVPDGVKIIGDGSFRGSKIENVFLPSSLEKIEGWAFYGCDNLRMIDIPDSVTEIGDLAFVFCKSLIKVRLSKKLKRLKEQVFGSCNSLTEIEIPPSVKVIEKSALSGTKNLENLILHNGLIELNDDLKYTKIKKLYIPKTVKKIESGLAILRRSKANRFEIEVDGKNPYFCTIDGSLYSKDKTRMIAVIPNQNKTFVVPTGVQMIERFVFAELDLEQVILPDSLTTIGHRCFENCKKLKEIRLPKSLTHLDFWAFEDCGKLEKLEILAAIPPEITDPYASNWKFLKDVKKVVLYVPNESLEKYKNTNGWEDIKHIEGVDYD